VPRASSAYQAADAVSLLSTQNVWLKHRTLGIWLR
jgi:hypothetical protein